MTVDMMIDASEIVIGKDILELLSGGMYQNPLDVYREYIQNSYDSFLSSGSQDEASQSRITIHVEPKDRSISILDNGPGIPNTSFVKILTSIGNSNKRSPDLVGFRGVGRLGGLGYAKKVIMRSKSKADSYGLEMVWNGVELRNQLANNDEHINLQSLLQKIVTVTKVQSDRTQFFEVKMEGVMRLKNDSLMNENAIYDYLSQVAPVPINPALAFSSQIETFLSEHGINSGIQIFLVNTGRTVYRPFENQFNVTTNKASSFKELELIEIPGVNQNIDAVGWVLHHDYLGAIPKASRVRGIRGRVHNLQVGDESIFEDIFPEARFNLWSVGEIHILNQMIKPNGRRDNFEHNIHLNNLFNHLSLLGKGIARKCRKSSQRRALDRKIEGSLKQIEDNLNLIEKNMVVGNHAVLTMDVIDRNIVDTTELLEKYEDAKERNLNNISLLRDMDTRFRQITLKGNGLTFAGHLSNIPEKHQGYQDFIHGIIDVVDDRPSALALINRVLKKIMN